MQNSLSIWSFQQRVTRRLLWWSGFSLAMGLFMRWRGDAFEKGIGIQAATWGLIDAGIAVVGQITAQRRQKRGIDTNTLRAVESRERRDLTRLLWINTGLDVVYMAGGIALARTKGRSDASWRGHGWGIVLQGAFLFIFDLVHARNVPKGERS